MDLVDAVRRIDGTRVVVLDASPPDRAPDDETLKRAVTLVLATEAGALRAAAPLSRGIARRAAMVRGGSIPLERLGVLVLGSGRAATLEPRHVDLLVSLAPPARQGDIRELLRVLSVECDAFVQAEMGRCARATDPILGFDEVFDRSPGSRVAITRVLEDGASGEPAVGGFTRTQPLFALNRAALWGRLASLTATIVQSRVSARRGPDVGSAPLSARLTNSKPGTRVAAQSATPAAPAARSVRLKRLALYPLLTATRSVEILRPDTRRWLVATQPRPSSGYLSPDGWNVMQPPAGSWYADPFLYRNPQDGRIYCFVEEFDEARGIAHISALQLDENGWRREGVAILEPYHLSFPFLFTYDGQLYMCPECSQSDEIVVYRSVGLPLRWERAATLMRGVSAADTLLFPHAGRWWMLTGIDRSPSPDHLSELHVFHADSPLSDRWTAVPGNPVRVDCAGARNGGMAIDGDTIYRFGQVQGFAQYGNRLNVYRITRLDVDGYDEELCGQIAPPATLRAAATHTYCAIDDLVAIDIVQPKELSRRR